MSQFTSQNIGVQPQNNSNQLQRQNSENTENLFTGSFDAVKQYRDLINGIDPLYRTQGAENRATTECQFSTIFVDICNKS
ncbi:22980_t:CDS:2 [Gigaspora margarita]|uniref:22980_t:CDS:1 n=1 Tax=Gigaspora margarita TaxID=4874 RepID=A0ABN7V3H4_GIGMA|nr:22980_t:CDS:2 [Gigaspora margarita]